MIPGISPGTPKDVGPQSYKLPIPSTLLEGIHMGVSIEMRTLNNSQVLKASTLKSIFVARAVACFGVAWCRGMVWVNLFFGAFYGGRWVE